MKQFSLFNDDNVSITAPIQGVEYAKDIIDKAQEAALIDRIDQQPWIKDIKRRTQHYGYRYEYKVGAGLPQPLGPLPDWLQNYSTALFQLGYFSKVPDQVIINEYEPGQGIAPHKDISFFGDTIASLSLVSSCVMDFTHPTQHPKCSLLLEPRSLLVLNGPARYEWMHSIAARKNDRIDGQIIPRGRRLSLTFRYKK